MKKNCFQWIGPALCCAVILCILFVFPVMAASDPALTCTPLKGKNVEAQNYDRWTSPIKSYLVKKDGGYMRFQAGGEEGSGLSLSYYDKDFHLIRRQQLDRELSIFGAFYETSENYYIVSGHENLEDSDSVEVIRLTKYDKDWNSIASCNLYGANTYCPFDAGNCRIDVSGSHMIIRTCYKMNKDPKGEKHQANVTIQVDLDQMKVTDKYSDVGGNNCGYVSHSFNQFVEIDNNKIVAVDHGDAYPRSICLMTYPTSITGGRFQSENVSTTNLLTFPGKTGNNTTGASVGGFEISPSSYLVAGNMVKMDDSFSTYKTRNIFLASVDKSSKDVSLQKITDYPEGELTTRTPHLIKINGNKFFLIWSRGEEISYVFLDGKGNKTSEIYTNEGHLSDCVPMVDGDQILWYTWKNGEEKFYQIPLSNPADMTVSETVYDHEYEYVKTENGFVTLRCKKCGKNYIAIVPTFLDIANH